MVHGEVVYHVMVIPIFFYASRIFDHEAKAEFDSGFMTKRLMHQTPSFYPILLK